jgi:(2Fe-2S) ferredoxin
MPAFTHHIFVCGNQRNCDHPRGCCDPDGNNALRNSLKAAAKEKGLGPLVRVNSAGCLEQCELGPTLVIYPQGIWYGNVKNTDIPRIVESLANGTVLEDLRIPDEMLNTKGKGPSTKGDGPGGDDSAAS